MPDEKFALPGSSYKELSKIIAAYATISSPTAPGPVGKIAVVHETIVSRNNKFLIATGLIDGGKKKKCTPLGEKLGRAIQHEQEDAIKKSWSTVISQTDFFQNILSAVRIRKGMEESALASHIAFTAGSSKNAGARAGAGAVIDILKLAGSISADGSTLIATASSDQATHGEQSNVDFVRTPLLASKEHGVTLLRDDSVPKEERFRFDPTPPKSQANTQLTITLTIACGVSELDGLGLKLRKLRDDFAAETSPDLDVRVRASENEPAKIEATLDEDQSEPINESDEITDEPHQ